MFVCLSGRYIDQELAIHYGRIPPAFLPVGNECLFERIARAHREEGGRKVLTLPEDFPVQARDAAKIEQLGFEIHRTDPHLSVTRALKEAVLIAAGCESLRVLFGDTLVSFDEPGPDVGSFVVVGHSGMKYTWLHALTEDGCVVFSDAPSAKGEKLGEVCGFFSFDNLPLAREAFDRLTMSDALNHYAGRSALATVEARNWHDFGHLVPFYQSKRDIFSARIFNTVISDGQIITKTSDNAQKMRAEIEWYESVPEEFCLHTPRFIGKTYENHRLGYKLEYLHLPLLSEMAVFGNLPRAVWEQIIGKCVALLQRFRSITPPAGAPEASPEYAGRVYANLFRQKTIDRLRAFLASSGLNLDNRPALNGVKLPPFRVILDRVLGAIPPTTSKDISFWHGDFFFGNLFFDFNTERVIMIDPRGVTYDGVFSLFNDYRYDVAKLAHSIIGGYDTIVAGRLECGHTAPMDFRIPSIADRPCVAYPDISEFERIIFAEFQIEPHTLHALAAVMFFSMLPLHSEDRTRQRVILANALSLYQGMGSPGR
ncbi:MAG: phosphotransferase [Rhodobacteraceae bacterium]|nr:phosphotransferase [Paracoccaceae bacterium]